MKSNEKTPKKDGFQFTTRRMLVWFVFAAIGFWGFSLLYHGIGDAMEAARASTCTAYLNQMRSAFEYYKDKKGSYPPLYTVDSNGKPMHSWRVLVLPYIGQDDLFRAYNFNEPWNGPNNSKLADKMPEYYQCCSDWKGNTTPFMAVSSAADPRQLNMSGKNPLVFVEIHSKKVNWLEPKDVSITELEKIISTKDYSQHHIHGGNLRACRYYPKDGFIHLSRDIEDDSDSGD